MRIVVLGSAAGGGLPQWNCRCPNCAAVRDGAEGIEPRTQSSVAVSADGETWFLLNASPDVRKQIDDSPDLRPQGAGGRATCIGGVVVTDSEIDHTTGLILLREGCEYAVYSTPRVRRWLNEFYPIEPIVTKFGSRPWHELQLGEGAPLEAPGRRPTGLTIRAFEMERDVPRFVPEQAADAEGSVIALKIVDAATGGRFLYAPGVAGITDALRAEAEDADAVLMDGTFWTNREMLDLGLSEKTALDMGHLPVGEEGGSLEFLGSLTARHRVYVHINNTNPMLNRTSEQHARVAERGVRVGADGDSFEI